MLEIVCIVIAFLFLIVLLTPTKVSYSESIVIDASVSDLYDNIRFQERLMEWSAWPSETKSTCSLENTDGVLGARTVFFSKGQRFGYQEITNLVDGKFIELKIESKGPPQNPILRFEFIPVSDKRTEVKLIFENTLTRPFNVILRLAGIVRWTRTLHTRDLQGLKQYSEPPYLSYVGQTSSLASSPTSNDF